MIIGRSTANTNQNYIYFSQVFVYFCSEEFQKSKKRENEFLLIVHLKLSLKLTDSVEKYVEKNTKIASLFNS